MVCWTRRKFYRQLYPVGIYVPQTILNLHRDKSYRRKSLESQTRAFRAIKSIHKQIPRNQSQDFTSERSRCPHSIKEGVWFTSKFRKELVVQASISLDDALHRASYFATHKEEVAALKEQYSANKNNATKKHATPKEPTTKGQHSYTINNSPQKSSTYDLSKYCAFHDRKGHSTEECQATLRNQNENKKTKEEVEEEEEPVTPKSNRKAKATTNKRGREIEQESPNYLPPAPNKRVDMISWGQNSNATDEVKNQTEGKICFEISVAIRTL
ncbi:hypothetical protein YC2023_081813 [Brassica napus]